MIRYKCPKCKIIAEIDLEKKTRTIKLPKSVTQNLVWSFPSHIDCELVKPLDKMDLTKLEKLG